MIYYNNQLQPRFSGYNQPNYPVYPTYPASTMPGYGVPGYPVMAYPGANAGYSGYPIQAAYGNGYPNYYYAVQHQFPQTPFYALQSDLPEGAYYVDADENDKELPPGSYIKNGVIHFPKVPTPNATFPPHVNRTQPTNGFAQYPTTPGFPIPAAAINTTILERADVKNLIDADEEISEKDESTDDRDLEGDFGAGSAITIDPKKLAGFGNDTPVDIANTSLEIKDIVLETPLKQILTESPCNRCLSKYLKKCDQKGEYVYSYTSEKIHKDNNFEEYITHFFDLSFLKNKDDFFYKSFQQDDKFNYYFPCVVNSEDNYWNDEHGLVEIILKKDGNPIHIFLRVRKDRKQIENDLKTSKFYSDTEIKIIIKACKLLDKKISDQNANIESLNVGEGVSIKLLKKDKK